MNLDAQKIFLSNNILIMKGLLYFNDRGLAKIFTIIKYGGKMGV
jgi:hypothetical protein